MKKNYLFIALCLLGLGTMNAQERTTLAFWDFEGTADDPYFYFVDDEVDGTTRAWVKPNEGSADNLANAKFSAYREGVDLQGVSIQYYAGMSSPTTTTHGSRCLNANAWGNDPIQSLRCWYLESLSTIGMKQIEFDLYVASVGTAGMTQFRFDYKVGDGEWVIGAFKDVRTGCSATSKLCSEAADLWQITLPAVCDNQAKVYFRLVSNDTNPSGAVIAKTAGASRVDDVKVTGVSNGTVGIANQVKEQNVQVCGNSVVAKEDTHVVVYNVGGATVVSQPLKAGQSIPLPEGFYIIETAAGKIKAMIR